MTILGMIQLWMMQLTSVVSNAGGSGRGLVALGAGVAITFAAGLGGLGIGMASGKAFEAMARQPEMGASIQRLLLMAIVFIEATTIYALVVSLLLMFVFQ